MFLLKIMTTCFLRSCLLKFFIFCTFSSVKRELIFQHTTSGDDSGCYSQSCPLRKQRFQDSMSFLIQYRSLLY